MNKASCIICKGVAECVFEKKIFGQNVKYNLCANCGFLFTERPAFWLEQSYSSAITSLDIGLVNRNLIYSEILACYIKICHRRSKKFLDFGGGYGLLTRIMRDLGFNYYRQDAYCENLFAKHFDLTDAASTSQFDLLTAFEVFEHLNDPLFEIEKMFHFSDTIFFSTELMPDTDLEKWYYLLPEIGQHISFYSEKSLKQIGENFGAKYFRVSDSLHILTKRPNNKVRLFLFKYIAINYLKLLRKMKFTSRGSLLNNDFESAKKKLVL